MWRFGITFACLACSCWGETHTLTMREAVDLALKQNPDVLLARLEERKAEEAVRLARAPFVPRVVAGSGLAYSSGFPMSIEGATPSIVQANAVGNVINRSQSYLIGAAKENRRAAALDTTAKLDEVAYRVAEFYLETDKANKVVDLVKKEVEALSSVAETVHARVSEGRELAIEGRKAELELLRARLRVQTAGAAARALGSSLAVLLGYDPGDEVRPSESERALPEVPASADAAVVQALKDSKEIRALESRLLAKGLDARSERAARYPRLDLVAQYGLLAKFNNYDKFFRAFERHNGQIGVSFQIPLFSGPGPAAAAARADAEAQQIRVQIRSARGRISSDTRKAYDDLQQSDAAKEIARLDLEIAREQVSILLSQMEEGRAGLRQVEEARSAETAKWIALYDAAVEAEKTRLALLRQTGGLIAALR